MSKLSLDEHRGLSEWSKAQSKSKKVEEWTNFPLATDDQRRNWWLKRREAIGRADLSDIVQANSPGTLGILPDASPLSTAFDEIHSGIGISPPMLPNQAVTGTNPGIKHAWNPGTNRRPDYYAENLLQGSMTPGPLIADEESQHPAIAGPISHTSPEGRSSTSDRWRKYF
ncbi:uncharacterized protein N0V89_009908 [Didymosphaeria variabile]|uniref:Uncharacterized protein n=1 Tax=Didymosphaeria variabile TaxID=1932322 RepID=A0A9W8XG02_9PLEO|nr:uncharacterized protein N0V89_009908 [Didymosphaeria variabile]KAJ4348531.1 hypothetical protein N0V89_009908 [Didymosphaeria variabile]